MLKFTKIIAVSLLVFIVFQWTALRVNAVSPSAVSSFEGVVVRIIENSTVIEDSGNKHPYQKLEILGTSGPFKGKKLIVENGKYDQTGVLVYKVGDELVLSSQTGPQGDKLITITDYVRRTPLSILAAIFVILAIVIGGRRGASSLLGMGVTFSILFFFVLPQVLAGQDPVIMTVIASIIIVPVTFFLSHGVNKKTICAIAGTTISLVLTGCLAGIFVGKTHLSGFASEEANYLDILKSGQINMQGLLLSGIIIGLLGVLQDITISQAAIVYQLKEANEMLGMRALFTKAMDVGRDHIASMANTLILVYAGASLPLLLLFVNNPLPISSVVNFEIISEEIVRTLVASIGLIVAVPITTALTATFVKVTRQKGKGINL